MNHTDFLSTPDGPIHEPVQNLAREAIGQLLDGHPPNGMVPTQLGKYGECYVEMARAYEQGGTDAARKVYVTYAELDSEIAGLRTADPTQTKPHWSLIEILDATFPEPKWAIPTILPTGLVVLAGRPKLGKSWLALQMAIAVGTGGKALNQDVAQGKVLYFALEDNPRRIQDRLKKQSAPRDTQIDFRFEWISTSSTEPQTLFDLIVQNQYTLVVIDTISRALGRLDQMNQGEMNDYMGRLQHLAMHNDVTILVVDHHRKTDGRSGDVIDDVMGATSKVGVVDAAIGLYRERGKKSATLKATGRDMDDVELAVSWDTDIYTWQILGDAVEIQMGEQMQSVLEVVRLYGKASTRDIVEATGQDRRNCHKRIQDLVEKGLITRVDGNPIRWRSTK